MDVLNDDVTGIIRTFLIRLVAKDYLSTIKVGKLLRCVYIMCGKYTIQINRSVDNKFTISKDEYSGYITTMRNHENHGWYEHFEQEYLIGKFICHQMLPLNVKELWDSLPLGRRVFYPDLSCIQRFSFPLYYIKPLYDHFNWQVTYKMKYLLY